jgi:hypothetical protein
VTHQDPDTFIGPWQQRTTWHWGMPSTYQFVNLYSDVYANGVIYSRPVRVTASAPTPYTIRVHT